MKVDVTDFCLLYLISCYKSHRDGVWDPEAWHKSNMSRSASPAVDGKTVLVEGKKLEL